MRIADIRQWQWILIALILGLGIGYVRQWMADDLHDRFGEQLNSQARFEQALLKTVDGLRCFNDVRVYAASLPDRKGGTKKAYLVAGNYFNGQFQRSAGKLTAIWRPTFFIADVPYQPATNLEALAGSQPAESFRAIGKPTVIDFLNVLSATQRVSYVRSRWLELGIFGWTACSLLTVGIIWPAIINLMVYDTLRRPPEEKGIDLSKVKLPAAPPVPVPSDADLARLQEIEAELDAAPAEVVAPSTPETAPAIQALSSAPLQAIPSGASQAAAEFTARQEDYYPTAKATPSPSSGRGNRRQS